MIYPRLASRESFVSSIREQNLAPLWDVLGGLIAPEPNSVLEPYRWRYTKVRPRLFESADLITTREAERRVLVLENPGIPGASKVTNSLFAGYQVVMPGETSHPHRHVQASLRFVIEGSGAYTSVSGERTRMEPGDFIITPSWTWHEHGNHTDTPSVWLDALDVHIVKLLEASFREGEPGPAARETQRPEGDALHRYGANMMPVDDGYRRRASPVFSYPYARTREALFAMRRAGAPNPWFGYKMRYINPLTGGDAMPTISTFMQLVPFGFATTPYRATDSTVFVVVEGRGCTRIGNQTLYWEPHDVIVVPSWQRYTHEAQEGDAMLFSFSDRGVQQLLGCFREERDADRRNRER